MYHASLTSLKRGHNKLHTVSKRSHFMTVIESVFCVDVRVINSRKTHFNRHSYNYNKIMDDYNTADAAVSNKKTK